MITDPEEPAAPPGLRISESKIATDGGDIVGRDKIIISNAYFSAVSQLPVANVGAGVREEPIVDTELSPWLLYYLPDRAEQQRRLTAVLQTQIDSGRNKPNAFSIVGGDEDCLDTLVERIRFVQLPAILKSNALPPGVLYCSLRWTGSDDAARQPSEQLDEVKEQLCSALGVKTTADKSIIEQRLANSRRCCLFHVGLSVADWDAPQRQLMLAWLRWLYTLDCAKVQNPVITVVTVIYPSDFFRRLASQRALALLRRDMRQLVADADIGAIVNALPEPRGVRFSDVEQWIREYVPKYFRGVDHEILRRTLRRQFSIILGFGERTRSMAKTASALRAQSGEA
jgi:inactive STAND